MFNFLKALLDHFTEPLRRHYKHLPFYLRNVYILVQLPGRSKLKPLIDVFKDKKKRERLKRQLLPCREIGIISSQLEVGQ